MKMEKEEVIRGRLRLAFPRLKKQGSVPAIASSVGISEKSVRCALRGDYTQLGESNYQLIRKRAIDEYGAFPIKEVRMR